MNKLHFKGYSGCNIELHNNCIKKYSSSLSYNNRFLCQLKKQQQFISFSTIRVPMIYDIKVSDKDLLCAEMEYINGLSFVQLFQVHDYPYIYNQFLTLFSYIKNLLDKATIRTVDKNLFLNKIQSISKFSTLYNTFIEQLDFSDLSYPIGTCHGDLTLSNIIFKNDYIYLIDFLDSFIETPYQDIIKLRQDLKFMWSLMQILNLNFDLNKIKMVFYYLEMELENYFKEYISSKSFHLLECMNYLRIVPYIKDIETQNYLLRVLKEIV